MKGVQYERFQILRYVQLKNIAAPPSTLHPSIALGSPGALSASDENP